MFSWGMAAALAMAAGTSLTITALALLVHSFRQLAVEVGSASGAAAVASGGLADAGAGRRRDFAGGGRVMWFTAVPAGGGIRPF